MSQRPQDYVAVKVPARNIEIQVPEALALGEKPGSAFSRYRSRHLTCHKQMHAEGSGGLALPLQAPGHGAGVFWASGLFVKKMRQSGDN